MKLKDVFVEVSEEEFAEISKLENEEFAKKIYEVAQRSDYPPETYGCLSRSIGTKDGKYFVMWKIKE